jgi:pSer/pThr/pTyr-binding forkhead associated (FHA) protein
MPPPPPARRRPTGVATPAAGGPPRARRATGQQPRVSAPPPPSQKLVVTAGPCEGQEFALEGDEVVIGRSADNAIAIPDTSVSRKHVLLRRTNEGWAASDMGSGNGTMVNGSSIAEETVLSNGDVVAMGDTEVQFVDEGAAQRPARRNSTGVEAGGRRPVVRSSRLRNQEDPEAKTKKRKLFIRIGAVLVLLMAGVTGYKIIEKKKNDAERGHAEVIARSMEQLRTMNQEARNLIRAGKWKEAKEVLEQVQAANPTFGGGTVQQYIAKTEQEIPNEQHLLKAAEFVKLAQLANAHAELAQVSADTLQTERREKVRSELDSKIELKLKEARELVPATSEISKMKLLLAIADDVLVAKPEHRDALEFKEIATRTIDRLEHPFVPQATPKTPWVPVQSLFANGDQAGALAMANACAGSFKQCKTLMAQIQEFNEKNRKLESLGPQDLLGLLELDRRITGGPASALSKPIATRVVTAYYLKATSAKSKGDWGQAVEYAKKVLSADPGHPGAQAIASEARGQSKDLYLRGYQLKDSEPDEAIKFFKQVLQMTVKGDEFYEKAKSQLDKLKQ